MSARTLPPDGQGLQYLVLNIACLTLYWEGQFVQPLLPLHSYLRSVSRFLPSVSWYWSWDQTMHCKWHQVVYRNPDGSDSEGGWELLTVYMTVKPRDNPLYGYLIKSFWYCCYVHWTEIANHQHILNCVWWWITHSLYGGDNIIMLIDLSVRLWYHWKLC